MKIRVATPQDAKAIAAIYAPIMTDTTISFELDPPSFEARPLSITDALAMRLRRPGADRCRAASSSPKVSCG